MTDNQLFTPGYSLLFMVVKVYLNTVVERIAADARHWVRDGHARQAGATRERIPADARHGVPDGHARQAGATIEYIKYW